MNAAPHHDLAAVTPAMQDYLKGIYHLRDEAGSVTTQHLAEALDVSSPSVTSMVKRLHELGLVRTRATEGWN
ncbi:MAG TPA: MarR family transcriptional regulator [Thermomicrobiales bacterium]|nr:MarR family transcriptional regulator [Thermomicrobiales bacterium]